MREAQREEHDRAVDAVHVFDVHFAVARLLAGLGLLVGAQGGVERGVDVLVNEGQDAGLLDRDDVVEIERLVPVRGAELFFELDGLVGRVECVHGDLAQPRVAERTLEGQPDGDG